jgi:hypothetical protein
VSASLRSRVRWVCVGFLVIAGFFLITEHTAHAFGVLPYVLLLACPLLHMLLHGRHHGQGGHSGGHDHASMQKKEGTP